MAQAQGTISVPDGVWQGTVTATVTDVPTPPANCTPNYVFARCFSPDGTLIWGAWFDIVNGQAQVGPFAATTWPAGTPAKGVASVAYFRRGGFGKMVEGVSTTFEVSS